MSKILSICLNLDPTSITILGRLTSFKAFAKVLSAMTLSKLCPPDEVLLVIDSSYRTSRPESDSIFDCMRDRLLGAVATS